MTLSLWVKPEEAESSGVIVARREGASALIVGLEKGKPFVQVEREGAVQRADALEALTAKGWHHLAVTAGATLTLSLDGTKVASLATTLPALAGPVFLGGIPPEPGAPAGGEPLLGFTGDLDELQLAKVERPAGALRAAALSQGTDSAKFLAPSAQDEEASSWSGGYLAIIIRSVTLDGWVVIGLLAIMFVVSVLVMFNKAAYLGTVEKANRAFAERFHGAKVDLMRLVYAAKGESPLGDERAFRAAPLFRMFRIVADEVTRRATSGRSLSAESLEAIRATLDSGLVRENQRLSERMVLLTIAISGGPFLGLLGTVVGVMITFASIAAAGDVNVNAIAPGIAAALVATVAGLAVAIPALFAYNWLLARIKNVTATMQVFADELVTSVAEQANSEAHPAARMEA
jgi:biopolymer transport protein ExbB